MYCLIFLVYKIIMRALPEEYHDINLALCIFEVNAIISKIILHRAYYSITSRIEANLFNFIKEK